MKERSVYLYIKAAVKELALLTCERSYNDIQFEKLTGSREGPCGSREVHLL